MAPIVAIVEEVLLIGWEAVRGELAVQETDTAAFRRVMKAEFRPNGLSESLPILPHVLGIEVKCVLEGLMQVLLHGLDEPGGPGQMGKPMP